MHDTDPSPTVDADSADMLCWRLRGAWLAWCSGEPSPRWQDYLPPPGTTNAVEVLVQVLREDIASRIKAGLPALLSEPYFEHLRLQAEGVRLEDAQQVELIHWEYLQRLQKGERPRRAEYQDAFPQHREALRDMKPSSRCPRCSKILILEETYQTLLCPDCDSESVLIAPTSLRAAVAAPQTELDSRTYRLCEELGRGGMGEVYRCVDPALGRDLAIKVMKSVYRGDAEAEGRFLREARITGSLQHPGIVSVHNLGRMPDGRLHYTMRLVRGQTLAALLKQEAGKAERLAHLLAIFEKVCQAVAYAHSKRVLHRDLKPANVMVGRFGEVQVMDWGLAKHLDTDPRADANEEALEEASVLDCLASDTPWDLSRTGRGMGTPAYMPPEQARGEWDKVDERADVFALGAILCIVLTGRSPYGNRHGNEVLVQARNGEVAAALERLRQCGADTALTELCRECLSPEREGRPRHAEEVAQRVASYQTEVQERLRRAELERIEAQVRSREERKRRRLQAALGLSALLILSGGVAVWRQRVEADRIAAIRQAQADGAAAQVMDEARLLGEQARREPLNAVGFEKAALTSAKANDVARAGGASNEVQQAAGELLAESTKEAKAAAKDQRLLSRLLEARAPHRGSMFSSGGKSNVTALAEPTAEEQFASAFRDWGVDVEVLPAAEAAAQLRGRPPLVVTELIAALDEWASQCRLSGQRKSAERVTQVAAALDENPDSLRRELRDILARGRLPVEHALGSLSAALRPVPVPALLPLGKDHRRLRQLAAQIDPASAPVLGLITLRRALGEIGEEPLAERLLRIATIAHPSEVVLYHTLGQMLIEQKPPRWAEAVESYRAARSLRPDLGVNLIAALEQSGRDEEGRILLERMMQENPNNPYLHFRRGFALNRQRRYRAGEAAYRKAIALKPDLAAAYNNLGYSLNAQRKFPEAVEVLHKAIELKPDDPLAHNNLGNALNNMGKQAEAEIACRKALELRPDYAEAHCNLGRALAEQGKPVEAEQAYRKAIAFKPDYATAYNNLGNALTDQGRHEEAAAALRKAIALAPDYFRAYYNLGNLLIEQGKLVQAEAAYRKVISLNPNDADAYDNLGTALLRQGRLGESEAAYRKAIALHPDADGYDNLGNVLLQQGRPADAETAYRKAIALRPNQAGSHWFLAVALHRQGRFKDALSAYRRSHALGSKQPGWRYPSLQTIRATERLVALEEKLPSILAGMESPASAADTLSLAEICVWSQKKRYAASARFYADAFKADPKLAADLEEQHRYNAACSAVLAAAEKGENAATFCRWALTWLREDLAAYAKRIDRSDSAGKKSVQQRLDHWLNDSDLASVRDTQAIERLTDRERGEWRALWREVKQLAKRAAK